MVKIDEFESVFRAAEREPFQYERPPLSRVTLVTDREHGRPEQTREELVRFLPVLAASEPAVVVVEDHATVQAVADAVEASQPDLIVAFRHLGESSLVPQHSLGVHLDVLTQVLSPPVLVLPGTAAHRQPVQGAGPDGQAAATLVMTDHIRGERRLIEWAATVAPTGSHLWLCHIEDDAAFRRYLELIGQIPELDTDLAHEKLDALLHKEAADYLAAAAAGLDRAGLGLTVQPHISRGHRLRAFRELAAEHAADLVVVNTKDDDQLAMQGTAYALAVELDGLAMLLV